MLELNENEKIDSWDIVVKTTEGRELSCIGDLRLELSYTGTKRIDQTLEEFYPCTWSEQTMYKCNACGRISEPKEKCNIVPVQTRVKHYKEGTVGREIVKEQKMCNECMKANSDNSEK